MIELYADIPEEIRRQTKFWFEVAMSQPDASKSFSMLKEYRESCTDEYEREFVDFYFNLRMKEIMGFSIT